MNVSAKRLQVFASSIQQEGWTPRVDEELLNIVRKALTGQDGYAGFSLKTEQTWSKVAQSLNNYIQSLGSNHLQPKPVSELGKRLKKIKRNYKKAPTEWPLKQLADKVFCDLNLVIPNFVINMEAVPAVAGLPPAVAGPPPPVADSGRFRFSDSNIYKQCWAILEGLAYENRQATRIMSQISVEDKKLLVTVSAANRAQCVNFFVEMYHIQLN